MDCIECDYAKDVMPKEGEYYIYCMKAQNRKIEEFELYTNPEWCPIKGTFLEESQLAIGQGVQMKTFREWLDEYLKKQPSKCEECVFQIFDHCTRECIVNNKIIKEEKPEWCPLREDVR